MVQSLSLSLYFYFIFNFFCSLPSKCFNSLL
uniref:Uncharacterized protein n=1 Tax=Rhizophora mucronata TaxID=61149 RepID=A0A2P2MN98_RHIMU